MKINFMLLCIAGTLITSMIACNNRYEQQWTILSPDGSRRITVKHEQGKLFYFVMMDGDTVIRRSKLGIDFSDETFKEALSFTGSSTNRINEEYTMVTGKRKNNHANGNELVVSFKNAKNTPIDIILRAYDEGLAFCYRFPDIKREVKVTREWTTFSLPVNGKAWVQPYALPAQWAPSYEEMYANGIPIGQSARDTSGYSFAALFHTNSHWILLTEAGLDENFYGSHLHQNCDSGIYKIAGPQTGEANSLHTVYALNTQPFSTPWRTIMGGKSPARIIESNLVHHLAKPSEIKDMSWIRPGRSSWSWWSDHASSK